MTRSKTDWQMIDAAVRWWRMKRPMNYSPAKHRGNPTVNCCTPAEHDLARAVAAWIAGEQEAAREWEEP